MSLPESKIKDAVKKTLAELHIINAAKNLTAPSDAHGYYRMPVPGGYGVSGLDFEGHYFGRFFAIETKAPGKKPTLRQRKLMDLINCRGERAFVVASLDDAKLLEKWLRELLFLP